MNEYKSLSDTPSRGALADGAEKFDRIARVQKTPKSPRSPSQNAPEMIGVSPDEIWAKSYMTYAIGSKAEPPVVAGFAPVAHLVTMPKFVMPSEPLMPKTAEVFAKQEAPTQIAPSGPIGVRIGKPVRKRSWLGRVFLGRT
jgi:hypothetical protein